MNSPSVVFGKSLTSTGDVFLTRYVNNKSPISRNETINAHTRGPPTKMPFRKLFVIGLSCFQKIIALLSSLELARPRCPP
jgi:hypothetical protein